MATWTKFQCFVQDVGRKVHNLHTDTLKLMLTNVAPNASTNTVKTDITEIAAGNGYTAGGITLSGKTYSQSGGTATLAASDATLTASGGSVGPFRYAVIYNDTASSDQLICFADRGGSVTLTDPDSELFSFGGSILTVT